MIPAKYQDIDKRYTLFQPPQRGNEVTLINQAYRFFYVKSFATILHPNKTKESQRYANSLIFSVGRTGIEPVTSSVSWRTKPTELYWRK